MISVESLRKRLQGLQNAQEGALAQVNANAGAIALCEELIQRCEAENDALSMADLEDMLPKGSKVEGIDARGNGADPEAH
jgi:hypothetical protein